MPQDPSPDLGADLPWDLLLEPEEVRRRFAWARRRGHPQYLWPRVPPEALRGALRTLERVARDVMSGGVGGVEARGPEEVRVLGVAAFVSGLGPLLGRWIEEGRVEAGELARRLFALHLAHGRARAERLLAMTEEACGALGDAGVEPLLVKSGHTARVHFPEPGVRPAVDADLVVAPGRFDTAEAALEGAGFVRSGGQRRPRKSDWLRSGAPSLPHSLELLHVDDPYAVDLHASLERNYHGVRKVTPAQVEDAPSLPASFLDAPARVLRQPALLAYHVLHGSEGLEHLTLVRLVELVLVVRRDVADGSLVWSELEALLDEAGGTGFAYPALRLAERLAPGTFDEGLLESSARAAPPALREVVEGLAPGEAQRFDILTLKERFMWCATPSDYARRLAHMILPAPANRSPRLLLRTYLDRAYRLLRGRVSLTRPPE